MHTGVTASKVQLEAAAAEQIDAMMLGEAEGIQMAGRVLCSDVVEPSWKNQAMHVWIDSNNLVLCVCAQTRNKSLACAIFAKLQF